MLVEAAAHPTARAAAQISQFAEDMFNDEH
jgi:hypothetical protein